MITDVYDIASAQRNVETQEIILPGTDRPETQRFESIVEPLFRQHTTLFAPGRANKPNSTINQKLYDKKTAAEGIRQLLADHEARKLLSMNGELEELVEVNFETGKKILDAQRRADCNFCYDKILKATCKPRIVHDLFIEGTPNRVLSFLNISSNGILDYVTVFSAHKTLPIEISLVDMDNFMDSSYDVANEINKHESINGMEEIINLGPAAESSQPHLHTRRKSLTRSMRIAQDIRAEILNEMRSTLGIDPVDEYLQGIIDSDKHIFHNEYVVIFAPPAPKYTHEIHIFLNIPRSNILELKPYERRYVGESMLGVFHFLQKELGVTDLTVNTYQSRFDSKDSAMRLHYAVQPKNINGKPAGLEEGRLHTVYKFPEETAAIGRKHYSTGR